MSAKHDDREAVRLLGGHPITEAPLFRVECEVCRRKGIGAFMGMLSYDFSSLDLWAWWLLKSRRLGKRQASTRTEAERRFGRTGQMAGSCGNRDFPLRPRCREGHMLKTIHNGQELFVLVNRAAVNDGPVVIPE